MNLKNLFLLMGVTLGLADIQAQEIRMKSDNAKLQNTFEWAVQRSKSYCMTGKEAPANLGEDGPTLGYKEAVKCIPSYWAGYANRTAFYERDFSHQSLGAHLVGLDEENFSMHKAFASHCTEDKKWYTWWALNFDGSVYTLDAPNPPGEDHYQGYPVDFKNPPGDRFVREVPANFSLIHNSYKCYLWTGDRRYVTDSVLKFMRDKSMNEFFELHDSDGNGIPEGPGDIWVGSSSYNERDLHSREAGDAASLIYAARLAYAGFFAAGGDVKQSIQEKNKAADFYSYFNNTWSRIPGDSMFVSAILQDGTPFNDFSRETTILMPIYGITEPGHRTDLLLDLISEQIGDGIDSANPGAMALPNIESYTYLPQLFFAYNRVAEAYKFVTYISDALDKPHELSSQGLNGDYPEISFTMVSNLVEGMMGMQADAPNSTFSTIPRLPEDTRYVTIENIRVGDGLFSLTHNKNSSSEMAYLQGDDAFTWEAGFYGNFPQLFVNGKTLKASHKKINGLSVSYVMIKLKPGEKKNVSTYR